MNDLVQPSPSINETIFAELTRRENAATSLAAYAEYTLGVIPAKHHKLICDTLDALLNDEFDELVCCIPPGGAKSTYVSHALAAYFIGRFPGHDQNVILATHTADLSERWSRKVRDTVNSAEHQRIFPHSTLSADSTAVGRWAASTKNEFLAAGVGGAILGFRAQLGIIDDPIKDFEQAQSLVQLKKIHDWYETSFLTRLRPDAKIVTICQRLSPNDVAGHMINRNAEQVTRRQRTLILKMECDDPTSDPLHRALGERLWPEWFSQMMVDDAKRDEFKWKTLYQQSPPSDDGSWVSAEELKIVEPSSIPAQENLSHYIVSDLALSVNSGDYSTHIVAGVGAGRNVYIVDAWRDRCDPNVTADKHLELTQTYKPLEALIDDDNASKVYVQLLASKARAASIPIPYKALPIRGQDKETRAAALRGMFKRGLIHFKRAEWNRWLIKELLTFPNALGQGVDDGVDALSLLGRRLASLASAAPLTAEAPKIKYAKDATLDELWETHTLKLGKRRV